MPKSRSSGPRQGRGAEKQRPRALRAGVGAGSSSSRWLPGPDLWIALALFTVVAAVFLPTLRNEFINYDDQIYVTANARVQEGLSWSNLKWAFTDPIAANWHPLTVLSHMLDCQWFGLKPWGHHLTSVLLHAITAALVFVFLRRATGSRWRSLFVAALFALHPLRVESVAWVAERKDVLSALFWMLTLLAYERYAASARHHGTRPILWMLAALGFFALGLMSKPMLVTLPFVLVLLDYWPFHRVSGDPLSTLNPQLLGTAKRSDGSTPSSPSTISHPPSTCRRLLLEKVPFFVMAAVVSAVTVVVQKQAGAMERLAGLSFGDRAANALVSYCRYLARTFYPDNLAVYYPHPGQWAGWILVVAALTLLALSVLAIAGIRRRPWLAVGWFWFVGTLVPVIGFIQVGQQSMADRYTYIPSIGLLLALTWTVTEFTKSWRYQRTILSIAGTAVLAVCTALTVRQEGRWRNSGTLFHHTAAVTKDNRIAWFHLGDYYLAGGDPARAADMYRRAIEILPEYVEAHNNLGGALLYQGRIEEAKGEFERAIELKPDYPDAHNNLGVVLRSQGKIDEAIERFERAAALDASYFQPRICLGELHLASGRIDQAIAALESAVALRPKSADAHYSLGLAFLTKGNRERAATEFRAVLNLRPTDPAATARLRELQKQ